MTETTKTVTKDVTGKKDLEALFDSAKPKLAQVLPKHLSVERVIGIAMAARSRNPLIMKSTGESILQAVMQAAQLGLEIGGPLGHAYFVPFKNGRLSQERGTEVYEVQFIPGYRGLIDLAIRTGEIESVEAHVVRATDAFEYAYGTAPALSHAPKGDGPVTHVYCIVFPKEGRPRFEVMTKLQVDAIRKRSKAADSGPWVTDYEEMMRKTVVKKKLKYERLSPELATAIDIDNKVIGYADLDIEAEPEEEEIPEPKRASKTKESVAEENARLDAEIAKGERG